jgi:SAM-dependent methyltransferase
MRKPETTRMNYWDERYKSNQTGWDIKQVSPPLKDYIDNLTDTKLKILIPGCGNAYEAEYLLNKGFNNVTLIDISPTLVNTLKEKFAGKPIRILNADFFEHKGKYDLILEQTFFCAIDPSLRKQYVNTCFNFLKDGGKIAGLLFNIVFEEEGPPYGGIKEEYEALFKTKFMLNKFDKCLISIIPRRNNELFIELEKKQG